MPSHAFEALIQRTDHFQARNRPRGGARPKRQHSAVWRFAKTPSVVQQASTPSKPTWNAALNARVRLDNIHAKKHATVPQLQLLRPDHASAVLVFELANRAFFARSISDRGDAYFEHFTEQHNELVA